MSLKHGESPSGNQKASPEYKSWAAMISRCCYPSDGTYKQYGAKGVTVCGRWRYSFLNFLADMGRKPRPDYSIDRYPNQSGNYEPENCRWATRVEQNRNQKSNRRITINGLTFCLREWEDRNKLPRGCVWKRLSRGEPVTINLLRPSRIRPKENHVKNHVSV